MLTIILVYLESAMLDSYLVFSELAAELFPESEADTIFVGDHHDAQKKAK